MPYIEQKNLEQVEIRVGTIVNAKKFPKAKVPAYRLVIDLGDNMGLKQSSAQITEHYTLEDLIGKQVICVCNLMPKQVANFLSEVLVTGFTLENGEVILAVPEEEVPNGTKLS